MTSGIIHKIGRVTELETAKWAHKQIGPDEEPSVADLVLPGTGHKFSDEFARFLRALSEEGEFA
jgi:hypothetical protein